MNKYRLELCFQVWNNNTGDRVEIKEDNETGKYINVERYRKNGDLFNSMSFCKEEADLVHDALGRLLLGNE